MDDEQNHLLSRETMLIKQNKRHNMPRLITHKKSPECNQFESALLKYTETHARNKFSEPDRQ